MVHYVCVFIKEFICVSWYLLIPYLENGIFKLKNVFSMCEYEYDCKSILMSA